MFFHNIKILIEALNLNFIKKIDLKNDKFNYLTRKKFNKINDIMLTTYEVKKSNRNINSISISFKKKEITTLIISLSKMTILTL